MHSTCTLFLLKKREREEGMAILSGSIEIEEDILLTPSERRLSERGPEGHLLFSQLTQREEQHPTPLLLLLWSTQGWSAKLQLSLAQPSFELKLPSAAHPKDRFMVTLCARTRSVEGSIARRRLGSTMARAEQMPRTFPLCPLVNSTEINQQSIGRITFNALQTTIARGPQPPLTPGRQFVQKIVEAETDWFNNLLHLGDETLQIRSDTWRTSLGHLPSSYFLYLEKVPKMDESVLVEALKISCLRLGCSLQLLEDGSEMERAEIVATAVSSLVTASPYIPDLARLPNRKDGVEVEQFSKSADTNSGDCEDLTNTSMQLWRSIPGTWRSAAANSASRIAKQFRHIGLLASAKSSTISHTTKRRNGPRSVYSKSYLAEPFTGHFFMASFQRMEERDVTWTQISSQERKKLESSRASTPAPLCPPVLTEGTGFTSPFPLPFYPEGTPIRPAPVEVEGAPSGFASLIADSLLSQEEMRDGAWDLEASSFYRWVVWAYEPTPNGVNSFVLVTYDPKDGNYHVGANYRHLLQGHPNIRFVRSPAQATDPRILALLKKGGGAVFPPTSPRRPSPAERKLSWTSSLGTPARGETLCLVRPGWCSPERARQIVASLKGKRFTLTIRRMAEFHNPLGDGWDRNLDDTVESTDLMIEI